MGSRTFVHVAAAPCDAWGRRTGGQFAGGSSPPSEGSLLAGARSPRLCGMLVAAVVAIGCGADAPGRSPLPSDGCRVCCAARGGLRGLRLRGGAEEEGGRSLLERRKALLQRVAGDLTAGKQGAADADADAAAAAAAAAGAGGSEEEESGGAGGGKPGPEGESWLDEYEGLPAALDELKPGDFAMQQMRSWGWKGGQEELDAEERWLKEMSRPQSHFYGPKGRPPEEEEESEGEILSQDPLDDPVAAVARVIREVEAKFGPDADWVPNTLYDPELERKMRERVEEQEAGWATNEEVRYYPDIGSVLDKDASRITRRPPGGKAAETRPGEQGERTFGDVVREGGSVDFESHGQQIEYEKGTPGEGPLRGSAKAGPEDAGKGGQKKAFYWVREGLMDEPSEPEASEFE